MKKIAILQSNYIPWKGYFDLIAAVDEFIIYDDMQFTKRDWRNRNRIKTPQGLNWLTIPVITKNKFGQKICETEIDGITWADAHWKTLSVNYRRAPNFLEVAEWLEPLYLKNTFINLSLLNKHFISAVCNYLEIETSITNSSDYKLIEGRTERLVDLCIQAGGENYITGPSAGCYLEEKLFSEAGINLITFDYAGYPEYKQLWGEFMHEVSILDLLFNCGKDATKYMKCDIQ